jgi:hypothetical protein
MADGAVRLPSGRLMPKHAQSKLESWLGDKSLESNSRPVERFAKASIKGMPPDF